MKSQLKSTLACALGAGLLTLGAGKLPAIESFNISVLTPAPQIVPVSEPIFSVNVQLTALTTSSRGKVQKTRITSKDLLNAIGDTTKGDKIVLFEGDFWIADKHNNLQENLNDDGTFEFDTDEFSNEEVPIRGGFRQSATGTVSVFFASAGGEDEIDSDLWFELDGTYSTTTTETTTFPHNRVNIKSNFTFSNLGNEGFDADISGDTVPMSGSISGGASGNSFSPP